MEVAKSTYISIRGAKTHNLDQVDLDIPHDRITVITGVSGSGKSSLAFDTLFAEGQRQYIESLSVYARQFLDQLQRPDVLSIEGLQPTLCIDQRPQAANPRSTVATVTEIYDYLRLLMARCGTPLCPECGKSISQQSPEQILQSILKLPLGTRTVVMAPMVRGRKGSHQDVIAEIRKAGLVRVRVDGEVHDIENLPELSARKQHTVDAIIDRLIIRHDLESRLSEALQVAMRLASGLVSISYLTPDRDPQHIKTSDWSEQLFSTQYACPDCGVSFEELEPRTFSFNSPYGACPECKGMGYCLPETKEGDTIGEETTFLAKARYLCKVCHGSRLRPEATSVRLVDRGIVDIVKMPIGDCLVWFEQLELDDCNLLVAKPIVQEMLHRLRFLNQVGVGYLTLDRGADTLSGGELQRVRLATCIGTGLVGVCYILDEPSIGLHQRDNDRLIQSIRNLQQQGNTIIVVEHDEAMMREADFLVDIGPGAGPQGGRIMAAGTPQQVQAHAQSKTAAYLRGEQGISTPLLRRKSQGKPSLRIEGACLHNLKDLDVSIPLGCLVGVSGVSGSGKSSLVHETLVPAMQRELNSSTTEPGPHRKLIGQDQLDKLIVIDQSPIGRTPRSTPATYSGIFDEIRKVFAQTRDAKQRGYKTNRFSFNAGEGRCETCQGQGQQKIEMNFLSDIYITCTQCQGHRFNRQTLQIRYKNRSIADALEMTIDDAVLFFENFTKISRLLQCMQQVGLGYLSLGQPSTTLSGGEAQRIKLATELARVSTGKTLYVLDEPTTGLHFEDIRKLLIVLNALVDTGNTVLVIEHNLDVLKSCDWLIDLGPEGGQAGGYLLAQGTPESLAGISGNATGEYLAKAMQSYTAH